MRIKVHFTRLLLIIFILILWEFLSKNNIINSFIFSSPSKIFNCIIELLRNGDLLTHITITLKETLLAFFLSIFISFIVAIILFEGPFLFKVIEPLLTMINSMPKVALGPIIIIMFGAKSNSIIIMALSITLIVNILTIHNSFQNVDKCLEKYLKTLNVNKIQKLLLLVLPSSYNVIINNLKINISMTLIGVIMGEFLVSKAGLGYLIIYGTQVFNLTLVMSSILILMFISYILYTVVNLLEIKKS